MAFPTVVLRTLTGAALASPSGLAFDAARTRLLVARPLANVVAWADVGPVTPAFATIGLFGTNPAAEGFSAPLAVAPDGAGNLVVLDSGNGELDRYALTAGTYTYDAGFLGGNRKTFSGTALASPSDLVLTGSTLRVLDGGNSRVVRIDVGTGVAAIDVTDTTWNQPSGLTISAAGDIFVADTFNHRVVKYPAAGGAPKVIGSYGTAPGNLRIPRGLALDAAGNLFVADSGNHRVQVFDTAGAPVAQIGSSTIFGSIKGLVLDGAGNLFVADGGRNVVVELGQAAVGPLLRLGTTTLDFGSVGAGYALDRPIAVTNDGATTLNVTAVASSNPLYVPAEMSFQVAAGATHALVVRFAPPATGYQSGVLTLTSDSAAGATTGLTLRGTGTSPPLVDAVLVLDRSGSMSQNAGPQPKMDALKKASNLFIDLARAGLGDRIAVVDFDDIATTDFSLTPVTDTSPSSRTAAKAAVNALTPRFWTSIGGGLEKARAAFAAGGGTSRKALLLVTDGMENSIPYVQPGLGQPNDPHVDLTLYSGITMHTVGLGLGTEVDLTLLASLATTFRGAFYLTEDKWLTLPKFFIEIFGDTISEFVTLDPEFELVGPAPVDVDVDLGQPDTGVTFAVYWQNPMVPVELRIVAPGGAVLTAATVAGQPQIRYAQGTNYAFFRFGLPLPGAFGSAWQGTWRLMVSAPLAAGVRVPFGLSAIVSSNLAINCALLRASDATGEDIELEASLSEYGLPIEPDSIVLNVDAPRYGRGELLSTMGKARRYDGSRDYSTDLLRDRLAHAVEKDPRFRERVSSKIPLRVDTSSGAPVLRGELPGANVEGGYRYRFVAEVERNGLRLRRECAHGFAVVAHASLGATELAVAAVGATGKSASYVVTLRPKDEWGSLLGPGLAVRVRCRGARRGTIRDLGDGGYEVPVRVPRGGERKVRLELDVRGDRLEWTWDELRGEKQVPKERRKIEPPETWPQA